MRNNPATLTDPTGLDPQCKIDGDCGGPRHYPRGDYASGSAEAGSCYADGLPVNCGIAYQWLNSGIAASCPNNFCSGLIPLGNGVVAFAQFNGGSGQYDVINQPFDPLNPQTWYSSPEGYLNAFNAQLSYVIAGLEQQGALPDQIQAFIHEQVDKINRFGLGSIGLEGGNLHFFNVYAPDSPLADQQIFNLGCENGRCDNGLDFSHGGDTFHRDTANPYYGVPYAAEHLFVDVIGGYFIFPIIPRH